MANAEVEIDNSDGLFNMAPLLSKKDLTKGRSIWKESNTMESKLAKA